MPIKHNLLQRFYPLLMKLNRKGRLGQVRTNRGRVQPPVSFYGLTAALNTGAELPFSRLKGKKVLLVNTASGCGFTAQYEELQALYERYKDVLEILAFPANDFKGQEPYSDDQIASFCRLAFGLSFPLLQKSRVLPGEGQHPVFQWLTDGAKNGWNDAGPDWNFGKYLVSEAGMLTHYFGPSVSPLDKELLQALE
jgi:glutathione peroxidase